jgi:RimJ/RimL family protein N-acetyltransferase
VSFRVRKAEPRDAPALVMLAREVGAEPEGWLIADGEWRSVGEERRHLRAVRTSSHVGVFVAETEHGVVGRLTIARDPHPACSHVADLGLMVSRGVRGRGIGSALLGAAEDWARGVGVRKIELHVFPHNDAAIQLYESYGFEREGYRKRQYRRRDGYVDAILMALVLD